MPGQLLIKDVPHREGVFREISLNYEIPEVWGNGAIHVADRELNFTAQLTGTADGVLVHAAFPLHLEGECVRCLDPIEMTSRISIDEVFLDPARRQELIAEGDKEAEEMPEITAEGAIDLEDLLRDEVLLELTANPLCSESCQGLCPDCGEKLADLPEDHHHEVLDPRWQALEGFFDNDTPESDH